MPIEEPPLEGEDVDREQDGDRDWVLMARDAYHSSTEYLDANYRKQVERNVSNFRNEHPAGSKYHTTQYKKRSRQFRPKTRTFVNKNNAAFAAAMFSTQDVVSIKAHTENDPQAVKEAEYWNSILNYRLTKTIPWFLLAVGAHNEAQVYGAVFSKQDWNYQERVTGEEAQRDQNDQLMLDEDDMEIMQPIVETDKSEPRVTLIEFENMRFSPAADWTDPIGTSPFLIQIIPMFVVDVLDYMDVIDPNTGDYVWRRYTKEDVAATRKTGQDEGTGTDSARTGNQTDKHEASEDVATEFDTVWVHLNFIRVAGQEVVFYTLGTEKILSDPKPIEEMYPRGRPYARGICTIEPHRVIPSSPVELTQGLQSSANDLENQRRDNINIILNKRKLVQTGKSTDLNALRKSVPGGITLTSDINSVKWEETPDVTSSSYAEQDRINSDFDALTGTMDQGSVQTNRALSETAEGMHLMSAAGDATTELGMRVFVETWCEEVCGQLVGLEQDNEDEKTRARFMIDGLELSGEEVDVAVNVGFGSTDPRKRLGKLVNALTAVSQVAPGMMARLDEEEVVKEVFGTAGYRDGKRFLKEEDKNPQPPPPDPMVELKMQELQMKQKENEDNFNLEVEIKGQELVLKNRELDAKIQLDGAKLQQDRELKLAELALKENTTIAEIQATTGIKREENAIKREVEGVKARNFQNELAFKSTSNRDGI